MSRALSSSAGVPPRGERASTPSGEEAVHGQPAGHVLDVRVEAAVLVDHDDRRSLRGALEPGR